MFWRFLLVVLCVGWFCTHAENAVAQAYAPPTEYHDRVQRHFVVECARVWAWRENQTAGKTRFGEVKYSVEASPEHVTTWKIQWLDSAGAVAREQAVTYPEESLLLGPGWYRQVAAQLDFSPPPSALPRQPAAALVKSFWAGAEQAQASRMASLRVAFTLQPLQDPAQIAGLLIHSALPVLATEFSLDDVLLARGAAWLCVAERGIAPGSPQTESLWSPLLFLAGREYAAAALWKKAAPTPPSALGRWWAFFLGAPLSAEAFAFAADPQYRRWAIPMLVYEGRRLGLGASLFEPLRAFSADQASFLGWHDYGIYLSEECGVSVGRIGEGVWPLLSRLAWGQALDSFQPEPLDFAGYTGPLKKWQAAMAAKKKPGGQDPENEASLIGLVEAAPLLNLGLTEGGARHLIPTAVVTARDLLNFGWEMNGMQMASRWRFVSKMWGVRELADLIASVAIPPLEGVEVFFDADSAEAQARFPEPIRKILGAPRFNDFLRLQEMSAPPGYSAGWKNKFDADKSQSALLWARQCWLRADITYLQCTRLFFMKHPGEIGPHLFRLWREGGPTIESGAMEFFASRMVSSDIPTAPVADQFRRAIIAAQAEPSRRLQLATWGAYKGLSPLEEARQREQLFWKGPGGHLNYLRIFTAYVQAHDYTAAERFYRQVEGLIDDRVGFSNGLGPRRFTLALMQDDRPAMLEAMEASATGSYADMVTTIMAMAAAENYRGLEQQVNEALERYPATSPEQMMVRLRGFLPLLSALKDAAHPDHVKALDYFAQHASWPTLQWILIERAKLPVEEAVRFLGGRETDPERRLLVSYLLKDKESFEKGLQEFEAPGHKIKPSNMAIIMVYYLRNQLLEIPAPTTSPDLKPPAARTAVQAFQEAFQRLNSAPKKPQEL